MSWEREVLSEPLERLVERNGAHLLAHQLQSQVRRYIEAVEGHAAEVASIRSTLGDAERIGLAVMRAAHAGRKTVRVSDLVAPPVAAAEVGKAEAGARSLHEAGRCQQSEWSCSHCEASR